MQSEVQVSLSPIEYLISLGYNHADVQINNQGEIVIYTGMMFDKDGNIVEFELKDSDSDE